MTTQTSSSDAFTIPKARIRQAGVLAGVVVALAVVVLLLVVLVRSLSSPSDTLGTAINSNEYQAVLLTNGQSFFGKLSSPGGDFYYLTHVYYLASQGTAQTGRKQTLIKLGNEIQGPEDKMVINRSQIVYVENLKPSGRVSQAILHQSGGP